MKKFLLIILLTILPIQYAWSMAAVYCQHEQLNEKHPVSHFGHHGHQHQAQAGDEDDDDHQPGKTKVHSDCEVCHHAVQVSVLDAPGVATLATSSGYAPPATAQYLSHIAEGPPRPNWLLVAEIGSRATRRSV